MREDMAKVIVERPRRFGYGSLKARNNRIDGDAEHLPFREGLWRGTRLRGGEKELNENLKPLYRFIERQVGRPWDKVFSEISAGLRPGNTVQQHVLDHLQDYVLRDVIVDPGRHSHDEDSLIGLTRWGGMTDRWYHDFYVDPRDGILKRTADLPRVKRERAQRKAKRAATALKIDKVVLGHDRELRQIGGLWFEITFAALPEARYTEQVVTRAEPMWRPAKERRLVQKVERHLVSTPVYDVIESKLVPVGPTIDNARNWAVFRSERRGDMRFAALKRSVSRAVLKKHRLID